MTTTDNNIDNLKKFIAFLFENLLDAFVLENLKKNQELNVPLLKLFTHLSDKELFELSKKGVVDFFLQVIENRAFEAVHQSMENWKADKIPGVPKEKVIASDITLVYNARKLTLYKFLSFYTSESKEIISIVEDLEKFYVYQQTIAIQTYGEIQKEEIQKRENLLKEAHTLLERKVEERTAELKRYALVLESMSEGVSIADDSGIIIYTNPAENKILGYEAGELIGKNVTIQNNYTPEENIKIVEEVIRQLKEKGVWNGEWNNIKKDGTPIITYSRITSLEIGGKPHFVCLQADITEWKKTQQALIESEERFRFMTDSIPQIVWTAEPDGNIDYFNKHWAEYTGKTLAEIKKESQATIIHPDDQKKTVDVWMQSVESGEPYEIEYRFKKYSDGAYRWHLGRALPMKDKDGRVIKWFGTITDIHDNKVALQNLEKANKELQKINMDLDSFVYTASHDLKAPIANIEGIVSALPELVRSGQIEEFDTLMGMVNTSIGKFKVTIQDLTDISRVQRNIGDDISRIDVCDLVEDIKINISEEIKKNEATINLDTIKFPVINFSKNNLRSIVYNLLSNAIKYKHPDRKPIIGIFTDKINDYCILTVSDNGLGIEENKISRMFGMFKRFHDHVGGTGIGLYIVKRIVENNGGKIEVESEVGKGTTFRVYFKI